MPRLSLSSLPRVPQTGSYSARLQAFHASHALRHQIGTLEFQAKTKLQRWQLHEHPRPTFGVLGCLLPTAAISTLTEVTISPTSCKRVGASPNSSLGTLSCHGASTHSFSFYRGTLLCPAAQKPSFASVMISLEVIAFELKMNPFMGTALPTTNIHRKNTLYGLKRTIFAHVFPKFSHFVLYCTSSCKLCSRDRYVVYAF
jgi:hypothetical protein